MKKNVQEGFFRDNNITLWFEEYAAIALAKDKINKAISKYFNDIKKAGEKNDSAIEISIIIPSTLKQTWKHIRDSKAKKDTSSYNIIIEIRDGNMILEDNLEEDDNGYNTVIARIKQNVKMKV